MSEHDIRRFADLAFEAEFAQRAAGAALWVRPGRAGDEDFLYALFAATQGLHPALPDRFKRRQFESRNCAYALHFPQATTLLVGRAGRPIGAFVVDWTPSDCTWGVDLAVLPSERRGAAGWRLLCAWLAVSDQLGKPAGLSVTPDNPARRIYRRLGFVESEADTLPLRMHRAVPTQAGDR